MGMSQEKADASKERVDRVPIREFQLFQLDIAREFMRICERHNLRYWAAYGTLLGAARHEGFIPWDDDIDFFMPVPDYYRFREVCKDSLGEGYYFQVHSDNPCNYISWQRIGVKNSTSLLRSHADIHGEWGVCIDIFPLAACPEPGTAAFSKLGKTWDKLLKASKKYVYKHDAKSLSGVSKIYHLLVAAESDDRNVKRWLQLERDLYGHASFGDTEYCFDVAERHVTFRTEWFCGTDSLLFEGLTVPVPSGYKEFLSSYYGENWMDLPPEEKRVWHSGGGSDEVLVSLTEPYSRYLV